MNAHGIFEGPGDAARDSWASEALPMAVRRQLLDRDLKKAGARAAAGSATGHDTTMDTGHPRCEGSGEGRGS